MRYERCDIKTKYPQKLLYKVLDENVKRLKLFYSEWKYYLSFRNIEGFKNLQLFTIKHIFKKS